MGAWEDYLSWNHSVVEAVYPVRDTPELVFLDLEGDALAVMAAERGLTADTVVPTLLASVRQVLRLRAKATIFEDIARATDRWQSRSTDDPPPSIALLAVFSHAAERMERDEGVSSQNYYGQLAKHLELESRADDLGQSYRNVCDSLWDSLAIWLSRLDGTRGLPVPFSVGSSRYVGRAKAQALIRDVDRRRFQDFFQYSDLPPRSRLTYSELEPMLNDWIKRSRMATKHIQYLWDQDDAKPHLLSAVQQTLQTWDGHLDVLRPDEKPRPATDAIRVTMRRRRLRRGLELSLALKVRDWADDRTGGLRTTGDVVAIDLQRSQPGEMVIRDMQDILDPTAILEALIEINDPVSGPLHRHPSPVVVLRRDTETGIWQEVHQVLLGDSVEILVKDGTRIDDALDRVSGTEWQTITSDETQGLPKGWSLVRNVTIDGHPTGEDKPMSSFLQPLVPATRTTYRFNGGLQLPLSKGPWFHHGGPPTFVAAVEHGSYAIELLDLEDDTPELLEGPWEVRDGALSTIDLAALELDPGRYMFRITPQTGSISIHEFGLARSGSCSVDSVDEPIVHDAATALGALCVDAPDDPVASVNGLPLGLDWTERSSCTTMPSVETRSPLPAHPWWVPRVPAPSPRAALALPPAESCHWADSHYWDLEMSMSDKDDRDHPDSTGTCRWCGKTKRFSNNYRRNAARWRWISSRTQTPRSRTVRQRNLGTAVDWDLALDAVRTVGSGSQTELMRIAQQLEAGSLFFHEFVRTLELGGHIEVARDPRTMQLHRWETSPTSIIDCGTHRRLVGHWTSDLLDHLHRSDIRIIQTPQPDAPSTTKTPATTDELLECIDELLVVTDPTTTLLKQLQPLHAALAALPRQPAPNSLSIERYVPAHDAWVATDGMEAPGAYRSGRFRREYVVVLPDDLDDQTARRVDSATAKHSAALLDPDARPLMAHDAAEGLLLVPLGAPLPGLYGRAIALAGDRAPHRRDVPGSGSLMAYSGVDEAKALLLRALLEPSS